MSILARIIVAAMATAVSACATPNPPPPPPISMEQFATYELTEVVVDTDDAVVDWPAAEREFAAKNGITDPPKSGFGNNKDDEVSDEDIAAFNEYEALITSDEAKAYYRERAAKAMKSRLTEALSPAFTGEKPLTMTVDLTHFAIRSSAAIALGASEGASGTVAVSESGSDAPLASSGDLAYVSANNVTVPYTAGLAGLAIGLAVSAAINIASDAVLDSDDVISKGFAQKTRNWLQLEDYPFPEK